MSGQPDSAQAQRLTQAYNLKVPDRPPILGGWLAAPDHIQSLTGCTEDEYWDDPFPWGLKAEQVLGSDGVIVVFEPIIRGEYRIVDEETLETSSNDFFVIEPGGSSFTARLISVIRELLS